MAGLRVPGGRRPAPTPTPHLPFLLLLLLLGSVGGASGWNQPEKILLREIQALTLHRGQFTSARRSAPVPQLQCTGGSAGCAAYVPDVVQCHNKGWDGFDVQWECKADLDQAYRFGRMVVSCEGYDYPEDPYVLRGSCGLEYNLELTEHGQRQRGSSRGGGFSYFSSRSQKVDMAEPSGGNGLVVVVVLLVLAYGIYKLFLTSPRDPPPPYSDHPDTHWQDQQGFSHPGPPPPGFKTHFTEQTLFQTRGPALPAPHHTSTRGTVLLLVRLGTTTLALHLQIQGPEQERLQDSAAPRGDEKPGGRVFQCQC
uniref:Store-operated calcium entry-associated regulatory factor n=1 Tax=Ornithorhynchus anatinus TaxID=9258 RepID=A0A6I8N960_ORNAN